MSPRYCNNDTLRQANSLGFIINEEKSELVPTQQFSFLGEDYDLALGLVCPTLRKYHQIGILCGLLKKHPLQEALFLLKVLGVMNTMADVIPLGRLHMRPLQLYLLSQWSMSTQPLSYRIFLKFQEHLLWWMDIHNIRQGKILHLPTETETLCMDSSRTGRGASLNAVHGEWDQETLSKRSINWLELKAIDLALDYFLPMLAHKSVMIRTDNTACVYNLKKEGGTHSPGLCYITWDILTKCQESPHPPSCSTSDGDDERSSGQVEQSEQGHPHGVVYRQQRLPSSYQPTRRAWHQSIRHMSQQEASGLCQSMSRPPSTSNRCSEHGLEQSSPGVRISSDANSPQGASENQDLISHHHSDSASLTNSILVSGSPQSIRSDPIHDTSVPGTPVPSGGSPDVVPQEPRNVSLPRLDVVKNTLTDKGFSN